MSWQRSYKLYPKQFKEEAVALILEQGYSVPEVERSGTVLSQDERVELKRLRRENKDLRMEKEILKKASQFFAK